MMSFMKTSLHHLAYRLSQFFLVILLIISPVLLGSARHGFELINVALAFVAIGLFIYSRNMTKLLKGLSKQSRYILVFMFVILPLWMILQATNLTPSFLHHPIWQDVGLNSGAISAAPSLTWSALMAYMGLSVVFIGLYMAIYDIKSAIKLQYICLMIINAISLFGLIVYLFEFETLGIIDNEYYNDWLAGTFVYKNAMANFVSFGIIICIAYLVEIFLLKRVRSNRFSLTAQALIHSINLIFLIIVQTLTGSRGGTTALLITIMFMLIIVFYAKHQQDRKSQSQNLQKSNWFIYIVALAIVILTVIAFYYLAEGRGGNSAISSTRVRLNLIIDGMMAIFDRPILGHGAGVYVEVEPLYHNLVGNDHLLWNKLHSTHIELLLTFGLPMFIGIYYFVFATLFRIIKRCINSNSNWILTLPAFAIIIDMLAQASFDFTAQVPAIGLFAVVLISLSFNQKIKRKRKSD